MRSESHTYVEIELDGRKLLVEPDKTLLQVAAAQGISVPTLCHDPRLDPFASCWVCVVKVQGAKGFVPACSTKVRQGMSITTVDEDIRAARRMALELLLSNHFGDCRPPCTLECPSNIDVQGYIGLIANGRYREALELIKRDNPFPVTIGRVCPRPCEEACRRNLVDEPVAIDWLKRFVADRDLFSEDGYDPPLKPKTGKRVAVVGAGPAGLSAAYYLVQEGVSVTVFESEARAGGMLRYGIPDYRLPQDALDREIDTILRLGVELKAGIRIGTDVPLAQLRREFDAVILAHGAWRSRGLRVEGEDRPGVIAGIDLLRRVAMGEAVELGRTVAVIGGGNTAIDSARTAVRLGAQAVNLFYRRSDVEMPASPHEVREAVEEGVQFYYLVAPLMVQEKGKGLKTLKLIKMELGEPDASGRRRPVPVEGSDYEVEVDTIVTAIGQYSDLGFLAGVEGLVDDRENLVCDPATGATRVPGVFAAGDLVTGPDIVIRAIAGGKHAARSVAAYLEGGQYRRKREFLSRKEDFGSLGPEDYRDEPRVPREAMPVLAPEVRRRSFDPVELGFDEPQALREAARCLECGCQDVEECRLKEYAQSYEADPVRYIGEIQRHPIDDSHPYISRDPAKCVLCGRCIRICLEVQGLGVLGYVNRGFRSIVVPTFEVPFGEDPLCISCGQCVSACPVGALTEKLPGGKTVPLPETGADGYCGLCSVVCPVEYRSHGTLLARIKERVVLGEACEDAGAPGIVQPEGAFGGRLCVKGRFQHFLLGAATPAAPLAGERSIDWAEAGQRLESLLGSAKRPSLSLSPVLSGEALERFLEFARRRSIPVTAFGLEALDTGWAGLLPPADAATDGYLFAPIREGAPGRESTDPEEAGMGQARSSGNERTGRVLLILGNLDESNNVAFTECLAMARRGSARLWHLGSGRGALPAIYRRFFDRVAEELELLPAWLGEAVGTDARGGEGETTPGPVDVLVNPEEAVRLWGREGERDVLGALRQSAGERGGGGGKRGTGRTGRATVRVTLFWNSRNGGYLFRRLATAGQPAAGGSPDLVLEAGPPPLPAARGIEAAAAAGPTARRAAASVAPTATVRWGIAPSGEELFIPLSRPVLVSGLCTPSGRPPLAIGAPAPGDLDRLLLD